MSASMEQMAQVSSALRDEFRIAIAFLALTVVAISFRLWARAGVLGKLDWDDYAMIVAGVLFWTQCGLAIVFSTTLPRLLARQAVNYETFAWVVKSLGGSYALAMLFVKVSLSFYFLRLLNRVYLIQRLLIWGTLGVVALLSVAYAAMAMATCGLTYHLLPSNSPCNAASAYCIVSLVWAGTNAVTDLMLSGFGVNALWNAQMPRRTKIVAAAILLLGTTGGIVSVFRFAILVKLDIEPDDFVNGVRSSYSTLIEPGVAITAACLACLRPLVRHVEEKYASMRSSRKESKGSSAKLGSSGGRSITVVRELKTSRSAASDMAKSAASSNIVDVDEFDHRRAQAGREIWA